MCVCVCSFAGYQTRGCSQPSEVNVTLKLLVSAVPVGLILLGLLLFKLYPIDEDKRKENKKALQDLRWVWARAERRPRRVPGLWDGSGLGSSGGTGTCRSCGRQ